MIQYKKFSTNEILSVLEIYKKEGWSSYLDDQEKLLRAFEKSLYLLGAFDQDKLIGFVRVIGDGEHIVLIQDLIVDKQYQKQGIGTALLKKMMEKYKSVRMFMLITDLDNEKNNRFYQSIGLKTIDKMNMIGYMK